MKKLISYLRAMVKALLCMFANLLPEKTTMLMKNGYGRKNGYRRNDIKFNLLRHERPSLYFRQALFAGTFESENVLLLSQSELNIHDQYYPTFSCKEKKIGQGRAPCRKWDNLFSVHKKIWSIICSLPFLLLLPYLSVMLFHGEDTALIARTFRIDDVLPYIVERQITSDYEIETMKCQAVIARSNFYRHISNGIAYWEYINECLDQEPIRMVNWFYRMLWDHSYKKYQRAVDETISSVLQFHGEWKIVPYHEISNGRTRDGEEVFHSQEYAYLKSVSSQADRKAPGYTAICFLSEEMIPRNLEILSKDSTGYVLCLTADGKPIEGETFREAFHLASTDFSFQKAENHQYQFICKGKGHGLGLSQYGANILAKKNKTYEQILMTYFPEMELCELNNEA